MQPEDRSRCVVETGTESCAQLRPELRRALVRGNPIRPTVRTLPASTGQLVPVRRVTGACSPQKELHASLSDVSRPTRRKHQLRTAQLVSRPAMRPLVEQTAPISHRMHAHLLLHPVQGRHPLLQLALARSPVTQAAAQLSPRSWRPAQKLIVLQATGVLSPQLPVRHPSRTLGSSVAMCTRA